MLANERYAYTSYQPTSYIHTPHLLTKLQALRFCMTKLTISAACAQSPMQWHQICKSIMYYNWKRESNHVELHILTCVSHGLVYHYMD